MPPHLYGLTFYGENIQDEWFIVEIINHLTKIFPHVIGRTFDADGEFILIEAAEVLPRWANPDTCAQRVRFNNFHMFLLNSLLVYTLLWPMFIFSIGFFNFKCFCYNTELFFVEQVFIYDGRVLLVQNDATDGDENKVLPISKALQRIRTNQNLYRSDDITECIEQRFVGANKSALLHRACVYLPISAALLLKHKPQMISYAIRAFCNRDMIDMKSCRAMKHFPPETRVFTQVTFTKCLYALLTYHNYKPNQRTGWNLPNEKHETFKAHDLGMKIACGLEICASKVQSETPDGIDDNSNAWQTFTGRLEQCGYFEDAIEGSKEYNQRLQQAKQYFRMLSENHSTYVDAFAHEIHAHLKDMSVLSDQYKSEISTEFNSTLNDSEDWLNISQEDLDNMMSERYGIKKTLNCNSAIDDSDNDATSLGVNLNTFLNQKSEFDGVDFRPLYQPDSSTTSATEPATNNNTHNNTGNSIDFNPDAFQAHLNDMLNFVIPEDNWDSHSDSMSDFDEEDIERKIDMTKKSMGNAFSAYMEQMDRELSATTIGSSFKNKPNTSADTQCRDHDDDDDEEDFDDIESFEPVDIDVNALKNLAESYKAQYGNHGPTTSLLNTLGIRLNTEQNEQDPPKSSTGEKP